MAVYLHVVVPCPWVCLVLRACAVVDVLADVAVQFFVVLVDCCLWMLVFLRCSSCSMLVCCGPILLFCLRPICRRGLSILSMSFSSMIAASTLAAGAC